MCALVTGVQRVLFRSDILDSPTAPLALDLAPARAAGMLYPIEIARIAFRTRGIGSAARPPGAVAYADPVDADALAAQRHPALDMAELVVMRRRHERRLARREAVRRMEARDRKSTRLNSSH